MFRRTFAVALLTVLVAAPCLGLCSGWSSSHHERMACCVDKSQDEADTCCASSEGRQNAESLASLTVGAPVPQPIAVAIEGAVVALPNSFVDLDSHQPLTSGTERHILLSVFLI